MGLVSGALENIMQVRFIRKILKSRVANVPLLPKLHLITVSRWENRTKVADNPRRFVCLPGNGIIVSNLHGLADSGKKQIKIESGCGLVKLKGRNLRRP